MSQSSPNLSMWHRQVQAGLLARGSAWTGHVCRVSAGRTSVSMLQICRKHLSQTTQRLNSEVVLLRPTSAAELQLLALWGKIPPVCSNGGCISVNLQDLFFKYLQLVPVTIQDGLRRTVESEWCFSIGSCASDMKRRKKETGDYSLCFPKG